MCNKVILTT